MPRTIAGRYFYNLAYSLDQFLNTIWGGDPDETISSRLGKMARAGRLRPLPGVLVRVLGRIDRDHCRDSIESDEGGRAVADIIDRCDSAVVEGSIVVRCRNARAHPGPHQGSYGPRRSRKWLQWG